MYFLFVTVYEWVTLCTLSSAIYFLNLFVLFGGGLCGTSRRSEDTLPCPASRSIRAATPMIPRGRHHCSWLFSFRRLRRNHPVFGSPVRLRRRTTSSCWIKSSVSTLAACQQRSARAARLWKHNRLPSALSYSNKEEHCRERRVCLTSVWSFFRDKHLWKRPTARFKCDWLTTSTYVRVGFLPHVRYVSCDKNRRNHVSAG